MEFSLFQHFTKVIGKADVKQIIALIKSDRCQSLVQSIHLAKAEGNKNRVDQLKRSLPAFTVSGQFEGGRTLDHLKAYCPYVILDIDQVEEEQLKVIKLAAIAEAYTKACFISPGGQGLKIIVQHNGQQAQHALAFRQIVQHYQSLLKVPIDQSGKDITRLCFMSWDQEAFYRDDNIVFALTHSILNTTKPIHTPKEKFKHGKVRNERNIALMDFSPGLLLSQQIDVANYPEAFIDCLHHTEMQQRYYPGNRNNFIYQLACNANREGIDQALLKQYALRLFDLPVRELLPTIQSAYRHHQKENGILKAAFNPSPQTEQHRRLTKPLVKQELYDYLRDFPCFRSPVFKCLPALLQKGCKVFEQERERDVFLLSALGVLSACVPRVQGLYHHRINYPPFFVFITAPAASSKGVALGQNIRRRLSSAIDGGVGFRQIRLRARPGRLSKSDGGF